MIPLRILTIVLDGMPWLPLQLQALNRLTCDWHWFVVEGAAKNVADTKWCRPQEARLSNDGTTEFLDGLKSHPRVTVLRSPQWEGKVAMCNAPLHLITEPCVLLQVDADEFHRPEVIDLMVARFRFDPELMRLQFNCRYFVGPNIITHEERPTLWQRAWRFTPGNLFSKHEPPTLNGNRGLSAVCADEFDHYSYVLESQVAYKEKFYGYAGAVNQWKKLQQNTVWPVAKLTDFLPWAGKRSSADLYMKPAVSTAPSSTSDFTMPSLDEILSAGKTRDASPPAVTAAPPPISASQAHKNRAGPFPRPAILRFLLVISFYDGDHDHAVALANLIHDLQAERNKDTDILFYRRHDAREMEPHIVEKMKAKFMRVMTHQCQRRNARGHPYGCNEMWYALVEMMRIPKWTSEYYAFFNLEPDCTPLCPDWIAKVSAEYRRNEAEGFAAIGHIKDNPIRHLNGAAVYSTDFFSKAGGMDLVGGSASVGYDVNHAKRILPVSADTPLIGGRWGIASVTDAELWAYTKDGGEVAVFHGAKDSSPIDAVRRKWLAK